MNLPAPAHRRRAHILSALVGGVAIILAGTPAQAVVVDSPGVRGSDFVVEEQVVIGQRVERRVTLRPAGAALDARGRSLVTVSATGSYDVPQAAERAYKNAAATMARTSPACQIPWTLLAGIGRVETDHGRHGGASLGVDGVARPKIIGLPLNGIGPVAAIRDTDKGRLDRDKVWDRAVGPMQFIPSTWRGMARDGDGDGKSDPHDIDDAALAAADYLCPAYGSILPESAMRYAIYRYNQSDYYVDLVMAFERGYRTGSFVIPSPPQPELPAEETAEPETVKPDDGTPAAAQPTRPPAAAPSPKGPKPGGNADGGSKPGNSGSKPPKAPPATPSQPPAPKLVSRSGTLQACGGGWCLNGAALDLGPDGHLHARAAADLDGDGEVESNAAEFAGLEGSTVHLQVGAGTSPLVVYTVNGHGYRNADGSFR